MLDKQELRRIAHILDLFYKNRQPGELKSYQKDFNPLLCINNGPLFDPECLEEAAFYDTTEKDEILKNIILDVVKTASSIISSYPIIYTRDPYLEYEVIGYFNPKDKSYTRYKIRDVKDVLRILQIKKNKPRGYYLVASYPDENFLENSFVQLQLNDYISEVQEVFPMQESLKKVIQALPIKKKHLRLI